VTMNCPKCGNKISISSIRAAFKCKHCGQLLASNFNEIIAIVGIVFLILILINSLAFYSLFGFTKLVTLISNLAVAVEIVAFYIFLIPRKVQLNENT
jgi:hypothetical protein